MATREQLHKLVDELPESQLDPVAEFIVSGDANGTDDADTAQPGDIIDDWGNLSAMLDHAAGDLMRRLAAEEAAAGLDPW